MFKKLFKSKQQTTTKTKVETISKNALKNIIGGGDPIPGIDVKLGHNPGCKPK